MWIMRGVWWWILVPCFLAGLALPAVAAEGDPHGVYRAVIDRGIGGYDALVEALVAEAENAGFEVLSRVEAGKPGDCYLRATVISILDREYAAGLLAANPVTAPYAVVDRINLYTDETGIHVSFVNPLSLNRTILMDDTGPVPLSRDHAAKLTAVIRRAVPGEPVERDYGQIRTEGRIGKTLGLVAGGDFADLLVVQGELEADDPLPVAASLRGAFAEPTPEWGLRVVHQADFPGAGFVVLGVTGTPLEARCYEIVGAGGDAAREDFECPGLAHAAAYPLELVVRRVGDEVVVESIDPRFRMKMFLEDAGNWALVNNLKMPGSVEKELREAITRGLGAL
jgi:hypothetical protein